jgi:Flp pilus assembly protein TadB
MTPLAFYSDQLTEHKNERKALLKKMRALRVIRLFVFLGTILGAYLLWGQMIIVIGLVIVIGLSIFVSLVFQYSSVKRLRNRRDALIKLNELELRVLDGDLSGLPSGDEFMDDQHAFSQDLDLFGESSFYQMLNRTQLVDGSKRLAKKLTSNDIAAVEEKQTAVNELSSKARWRQSFSAEGIQLKTKVSTDAVRTWFENYKSFAPKSTKILVSVISLLSLALIALNALGFIPGSAVILWFLVGGGIIGSYLKKISKLASHLGEIQDVFQRYATLLNHVETEEFVAPSLVKLQERVQRDEIKASQLLQQFAKLCSSLDQRNNILMSIPANGFFLRDLRITRKIEQWIDDNKEKVDDWFEVVAEFDALNSLGNYAFNHPAYVYATLAASDEQVKAEGLGHPLLKVEGRVDSDYQIKQKQFFIVTGANMAGKSTFLRTVGLSLMMSNCGLPVCAKQFLYRPIKLISSMRTTDSLSDNASYFFSELKRLKVIIDTIANEDHFIILDEILKGTNSKDKAEGSKQFVQKLVKSKSTGIIATHDLSLCELSDSLPEVKNYYFDAEIINNELYFDYRLKDGICQNMNASFLLRKMEII